MTYLHHAVRVCVIVNCTPFPRAPDENQLKRSQPIDCLRGDDLLTKLLLPFPSSIRFLVYVLLASPNAYEAHSSEFETYLSINSCISMGSTSLESRPELGPSAELRSSTSFSKAGFSVIDSDPLRNGMMKGCAKRVWDEVYVTRKRYRKLTE